MNTTGLLAKHLREVHFGGNWTGSNLRDSLKGVQWHQAIEKVQSFNTIAALVFHVNYYVITILKVLRKEPLDAHDKFSFDLPPIQSEEAWNDLLQKTWNDAENLSAAIENFPEERLWDVFVDQKYGSYYRNFLGVIEHAHYHLGQIVLIKKLVLQTPTGRPVQF